MNAKQINKSRMYAAITTVLDHNAGLFQSIPELISAHRTLKEKLVLIDRQRQVQEVNNTGLTRNKVVIREELTTLLLRFSVALTALATVRNDAVLLAKVGYKMTDLRRSSDQELCDIAVLINTLATPEAGELQTYFVGPDELAKFDNLTTDLKAAMPLRRAASNVSKVSTTNIQIVYHDIDSLLKTRLDLLLQPFRFSQPDFFNAYKNGRKMVNYSGRGKAVGVV